MIKTIDFISITKSEPLKLSYLPTILRDRFEGSVKHKDIGEEIEKYIECYIERYCSENCVSQEVKNDLINLLTKSFNFC